MRSEAGAMGTKTTGWQKELHLPSERGASRHIMEALLDQLASHGWPQSDVFAIHMAAEEAITNAIVHGNKLDESKTVHVVCRVAAEMVRIEVTDQGPGFDPKAIPDCTLEERLDVPNGRGVMLMRSFMTKLEYNAKGNRVLMEKQRDPAAADAAE
jgi:serine/threonine-protein kinase RsbW